MGSATGGKKFLVVPKPRASRAYSPAALRALRSENAFRGYELRYAFGLPS